MEAIQTLHLRHFKYKWDFYTNHEDPAKKLAGVLILSGHTIDLWTTLTRYNINTVPGRLRPGATLYAPLQCIFEHLIARLYSFWRHLYLYTLKKLSLQKEQWKSSLFQNANYPRSSGSKPKTNTWPWVVKKVTNHNSQNIKWN